jgi:L-amino acid N-acyltransferase YncA
MTNIRKANIGDAKSLSDFLFLLDAESDYLLYDNNERHHNESLAAIYLSRISSNPKSIVFIALNERDEIIAYIAGETPNQKRLSHTMKMVIGVLKQYRGLGRLLSYHLLKHAKAVGITRLEAGIITHNKLSVNLCRKMDMEIEGVKKNAIKIGDSYLDEYMMARLL